MKILITFLLLLIAFINLPAQQKAGELKLEPYVFEAANGNKVEAERGFLTVPENRKNPKSRLIEITFVRFKSTSANPQSPIVYLAGGPGSSGIAAAQGARFPMFMALREVADVIALDQRGVGYSRPNLLCRETLDAPLDKALSEAEYLQIGIERSKSCAKRFIDEGVDLTGYNTIENSDDLEDLRKALGTEKINLVGISYGTHLGLTTLKRHGKIINKAILAGIEGLDHTYKSPLNTQLQLQAIANEIKADAELSQTIPDFLALIKRVLDNLEKNPQTVEVIDPRTSQKVKITLGKTDLQILTASVLGDTPTISQLPAIYYAMDKGDFTIPAQQILGFRKRFLGSAMMFMMDCASGISKKRFNQIEKEAENTLLGKKIDFPFPKICEAWNQNDLGDNFRASFKTNVPTLFISGTLDGRTPVSNAEETRQGFSNSQHLIIERAGHSDDLWISSPKIVESMLAFLKGEKITNLRITLPPLKWRKI